jgi:hypothetical protein
MKSKKLMTVKWRSRSVHILIHTTARHWPPLQYAILRSPLSPVWTLSFVFQLALISSFASKKWQKYTHRVARDWSGFSRIASFLSYQMLIPHIIKLTLIDWPAISEIVVAQMHEAYSTISHSLTGFSNRRSMSRIPRNSFVIRII